MADTRERQLEYWRDRETKAQALYIKDERKYARVMKRYYADMFDEIEKEIDAFIGRYAEKEQISYEEAYRRVDQTDIEKYERLAEKYVKNKDLSPRANSEMRLYNLTMKINRLEMLKARIGVILVSGTTDIDNKLGEFLKERTEAELTRQSGILGTTIRHNERYINNIVNSSFKGARYSQRIWANEFQLKTDIERLLVRGMVSGQNPKELARYLRRNLRDVRERARYNTERLMRTEMARCQVETFKSLATDQGYKSYIYVACHKTDVCDVCRELDGKVFKLADMEIGENAPPMHPNCHCSVHRYYSRDEFEEWLKDNGF